VSGTELRQRLAAILAADVAGYSRLMAADERATVAALDAARAVFRAQIESSQGRVIDMAGDSVLAVFETATGAVATALAAQLQLNTASSALPEERRMRFRIGVHLGDVIEKVDGTIYGDGVNIAARLEELAEPGGITVSDSVRNAVKGKVGASFEDQGEQKVKNITEPVRAYRVGAEGIAAPKPTLAVGEIDLSPPDKPSIAVLPFDNMSGDPEQAYFADGIAEDIITALSRFRQFHVTARNSSFTYKGQAIDIKKVGQELGVRYVLEGSVRRAGDRVRITAQLIDTQSGNHVWADRYDGRLENIFDLQDEITNTIAAAVTPAFAQAELQRSRRKRPENLDAWELSLRATQVYGQGGPNDLAEARDLVRRALLLDSRNPAALSLLSACHATEALLGYSTSPSTSVAEAVKAARLAVREDSSDADSLATLGFALLGARQFDEALDLMRQAVTLNPNYAQGFGAYGTGLAWCGEYEKCIEALDRAMRLSPRDPRLGMWFSLLALAAFIAGQHEAGVGYGRRSVQCSPGFLGSHRALAVNLSAIGQMDEAKREVAEVLRIKPELTVATMRAATPFRDNAARERYCAALARAGLPD
jgi:adenylate cyclase